MNWSNLSTPVLCLLVVGQCYCPCATNNKRHAQEASSASIPATCRCGHRSSEGVGTTAWQNVSRTPSPQSPAAPSTCQCGREVSLLTPNGARAEPVRQSSAAWLPANFTTWPLPFSRVEDRAALCRGVPFLTTDDLLFAFHILRC